MDVKNLSNHLNYFSTVGLIFSTENRVLLLNSLSNAKKSYRFTSMQFWGKVNSLKEDYYIVTGMREDGNKQVIYSVNIFDWNILEDAER